MLAVNDLVWEPDETWRVEAACSGVSSDLFFPVGEDPESSAAAKDICAVCPVREACLQYAISTNQTEGVWGGLDANERRRMRRRLRDKARRKAS
jgi:WhiB family redox-sensing transcriptional regulator